MSYRKDVKVYKLIITLMTSALYLVSTLLTITYEQNYSVFFRETG